MRRRTDEVASDGEEEDCETCKQDRGAPPITPAYEALLQLVWSGCRVDVEWLWKRSEKYMVWRR